MVIEGLPAHFTFLNAWTSIQIPSYVGSSENSFPPFEFRGFYRQAIENVGIETIADEGKRQRIKVQLSGGNIGTPTALPKFGMVNERFD